MSNALDPSLRGLTACGCCQGIAVSTPVRIDNRPGLAALAYRVGTRSQFKQSLLARLSAADHPALRVLSTREDNDFTIGLLDAWSTAADVLTFYQERIANEAYLRSATERMSVLELARLIGYQLDPGVAASAYLAFEVESSQGAFGQALASANTVQAPEQRAPTVKIEAGLKMQSIPGPGESAQTFETIETIEAHAEQNAIPPRLKQPQKVSGQPEPDFLILKGTNLNLAKGDLFLIEGNDTARTARTARKVSVNEKAETTRVNFVDPPAKIPSWARSTAPLMSLDGFLAKPPVTPEDGLIPLKKNVIAEIIRQRWRLEDLNALIELQSWDEDEFLRSLRKQVTQGKNGGKVYVFRQRTKVFGYNAPKKVTYDGRTPKPADQWEDWNPATGYSSPPASDPEEPNKLFLAEANKKIVPGGYVATEELGDLSRAQPPQVYEIESVRVHPRTAYGISSETTELIIKGKLHEAWDPTSDFQLIRTATVYAESEELELAELPIEDEIKAETVAQDISKASAAKGVPARRTAVILDQAYLGLQTGQTVILGGARTDLKGITTSEALTIKQAWLEEGFTVLEFEKNLEGTYERATVKVNANVAAATHGETVQETLGSGDGSQPFQGFTLKQTPLTHVSAATSGGAQSTLEVRVNNVLWKEVSSFCDCTPEDRVYVTQLTDDGKTTVVFGDGITGSRLPTGVDNVTAKYRKGIGLGGLVKAGQLSQLMTRPLGVKSAVNPRPATGAEDPDTLAQARRNSPITVLTLDRIVSLRDYEDFARDFAGIDKALATPIQFGETRGVFLTVAGPRGAEIAEDSATYKHLVAAIRGYGDPNVPFVIDSYRSRLFRVQGTVKLKSDYLVATVKPLIDRALRERYSFDAREFGQPVALSEIVALIQAIEGVSWIDIDTLEYSDKSDSESADSKAANADASAMKDVILVAEVPSAEVKEPKPAELLTLDPRPLELEVSL